jgi:hypothetical protein
MSGFNLFLSTSKKLNALDTVSSRGMTHAYCSVAPGYVSRLMTNEKNFFFERVKL